MVNVNGTANVWLVVMMQVGAEARRRIWILPLFEESEFDSC